MGSRTADEEARRVSGRQADTIHRDQLRAAGLSNDQIKWRISQGRLRRCHPRVYLTATAPPTRHTLAWAAVLYAGPRAAASHRIAAALYLPRLAAPDVVEVTVVGRNPGRTPGVAVHRVRHLTRGEVRHVDGLPVTSPARTVLDLAATRPRKEVEYALQELIFLRKLSDSELRRATEHHPRHRGTPMLRDILELEGPHGSGISRSEAERAFARLIRDADLPRPLKNARIEGFDIDTVWPDQRLIVEVDGGGGHDHAYARRRDRRRDQRLGALGWRVIRFTAREVLREPLRVAAELGVALAGTA